MRISGSATDKLMFAAIYIGIAVILVIQGARHLADYALDASFFNDYLCLWETRLVEMRQGAINWPPQDRNDPAGYMQQLADVMRRQGISPPRSNTDRPYVYRLQRFGRRAVQVLLVSTRQGITLFNLPTATFERIDRFVDGASNPDSGSFTGNMSADGVTRIAYWKV
ncbi:MAG: hypothetical protein HKP58_20605 [Desulfatitalea sp.]|nr:hypothetical protein [Desulfatitalea sp.]NNK02820.1 hypothetical protein [Desulfatitalea sp.]